MRRGTDVGKSKAVILAHLDRFSILVSAPSKLCQVQHVT